MWFRLTVSARRVGPYQGAFEDQPETTVIDRCARDTPVRFGTLRPN